MGKDAKCLFPITDTDKASSQISMEIRIAREVFVQLLGEKKGRLVVLFVEKIVLHEKIT